MMDFKNKSLFGITLVFVFGLVVLSFNVSAEDNCTEDIYECTEWSECSIEGYQTRSCTLISICPNADNDMPPELMECNYVSDLSKSLECSDLYTSKERIRCMLDVENSPPENLNIAYLPEECATVIGGADKDECILRYSDAEVCFGSKLSETDSCLKNLFDLSRTVSSRKNVCGSDESCLYALERDVTFLAKFRIHELEKRVERMLNLGLIDESSAVDMIYYLEQQKLSISNSPDKNDRVNALSDIKERWTDFIDDLEDKK